MVKKKSGIKVDAEVKDVAIAAVAVIAHIQPKRNTVLLAWATLSISLLNLVYFTGAYFAFKHLQASRFNEQQNKTQRLLADQAALILKHPLLQNSTTYSLYTDAAERVCTITRSPRQVWSYWAAFDFCVSIVTTVGYGVLHPTTWYSKVACCVYAAIGLPLYLVMLGAAGKYIVFMFEYLNEKSEMVKVVCRHRIVELALAYVNIAIVLAIFLCAYSYFGYAASNEQELYSNITVISLSRYHFTDTRDTVTVQAPGWSILQSFYYSMISLTTIGFGDYYLGNPEDPRQAFMLFISVSFGFALFSYAFQMYSKASERQLKYLTAKSEQMSKRAAKVGIKATRDSLQQAANFTMSNSPL